MDTKPKSAVIEWLLESDPSIRWQTMQDLTHAPTEQVKAERARVASGGLGAQVLAQQGADGTWAGVAWNHGWNSTMHALTLLREMGLDPDSDTARQAVGRVREQVHWVGWDWHGKWRGEDFVGNPFFAGEVEPCINGQVAASAAYFGQDISRILGRLLNEQLADGGWNCEAENGSTRGSFNTTIDVLEALLEYELAGNKDPKVTEARLRGQEYLLERKMFKRKSTGEVIVSDKKDGSDQGHPPDGGWPPAFTRFAFPTWWHYDVLRGLDYLRRASAPPDPRMADAIALVESKRDAESRWPLEVQYPGVMLVETDEGLGQPSRWNTLRALRVLDWYGVRS
jgi:hypothetical protein